MWLGKMVKTAALQLCMISMILKFFSHLFGIVQLHQFRTNLAKLSFFHFQRLRKHFIFNLSNIKLMFTDRYFLAGKMRVFVIEICARSGSGMHVSMQF
jgi:hypothetical protein